MGTLNLASLITEVRAFHAGRPDLDDEIIITQLNRVHERLARLWQWEELDSGEDLTLSIAGTALADKIVTPTITYRDIYSIRLITGDGQSRKLEYIAKRTFDQLFPEPEFHARGTPAIYTMWQDKLELFQVPSEADTLRIRGMKWPSQFAGSDTAAKSNFDRKDDILIYWAVSMLWDRLGEYERAKRFFGIANQMIEQAKEEQESKPDREIKPAFETGRGRLTSNYWLDPFIKSVR